MKSSNKSDRVVPMSQIIRIAKICTKRQCSAERVLENVVLVAILSIRQGIPASAARMTGCSFCFAVYLSTSGEVLTTLHSQRGMNPQIRSQHPSQLIKWLKLPETENLQPSISAKKNLALVSAPSFQILNSTPFDSAKPCLTRPMVSPLHSLETGFTVVALFQ